MTIGSRNTTALAQSVEHPGRSPDARTLDTDNYTAMSALLNAKGKGKATQEVEVVESDEEDEEGRDDEAGVPNLEDDEKFEEDHADAVRAAIEAKRKVHGVSNI